MIGRRGSVGRRGPGLVRTVGRTAVIAGTATVASVAVSNKMAKNQAAKNQQETEAANADQELAAVEPQPMEDEEAVQAESGSDLTAQLQQLVQLKESGMLTDEEFSAAKAKLLTS